MRQCCDRELRGNSQDNELYYLDTIKSYKPINNQQKRREKKEKDRLISVYFGFLTQLSLPTSEMGALPYMRAI